MATAIQKGNHRGEKAPECRWSAPDARRIPGFDADIACHEIKMREPSDCRIAVPVMANRILREFFAVCILAGARHLLPALPLSRRGGSEPLMLKLFTLEMM
jgi:hypothetical protein